MEKLIVCSILYMIEPIIWMKVFSKLYHARYKRCFFYFLEFLVMYVPIVLKQYITFTNSSNIFNMIYLPVYVILLLITMQVVYESKLAENILCIGILLLFSMITDVLSLCIGMFVFNYTLVSLSMLSWGNVICTLCGRLLMILMYLIIFTGRKVHIFEKVITTKDVLIMLGPNFFITVIYFILIHNLNVVNDTFSAIYFIVLINAISFIFSFSNLYRISNIRRKILYENETKQQNIVFELQLYDKIININREYKKHCDNTFSNLARMDVFCNEKNFNAIQNFLKDWSEKEENRIDILPIYSKENFKVEFLLKEFEKYAKSMGIFFKSYIGIQNIELSDEEACTILSVLVQNAIDATRREPEDKRDINVLLDYSPDGYFFMCENSQEKQPLVQNDEYILNQNEIERYGYSITLVKKIAYKHNGYLKYGYQKGFFSIFVYFGSLI